MATAIVCDETVVGGGWGGVYFAHRRATLAVETKADTNVCLFERSDRIGGRTYSVPINGTPFTLDIGAYRCGHVYIPITHLIIVPHFQQQYVITCFNPFLLHLFWVLLLSVFYLIILVIFYTLQRV